MGAVDFSIRTDLSQNSTIHPQEFQQSSPRGQTRGSDEPRVWPKYSWNASNHTRKGARKNGTEAFPVAKSERRDDRPCCWARKNLTIRVLFPMQILEDFLGFKGGSKGEGCFTPRTPLAPKILPLSARAFEKRSLRGSKRTLSLSPLGRPSPMFAADFRDPPGY